MKIRKFNEARMPSIPQSPVSSIIADAIEEIINPWINKLQIFHIKFSSNYSFRIWKALNNETFEDYMNLLKELDKYGLIWYIDNDTCHIDLDKYNDEMKTYINAKKYNI